MWQRIVGCLLLVALSGCSYFKQQDAAPVTDIGEYRTVTQGTHIVRRGETLYEIAWRYGRDYRDIALANHIPSPYVIYPGQHISLKQPKYPPSGYATEKSTKPIAIARPTTTETKTGGTHANTWQWPVKGKILKSYSPTAIGPKGIDIGGKIGTPVLCAHDGKVVYSGHGLRGYGLLVIVKHDDTYLSAYGHNSVLIVKEGQVVTKGQEIAKMGNSDSPQVKLHFEIRKNGQPINPLNILPPRPV